MEQFVWAIALSTHVGLEGDYNSFHPHVRFLEDGAIAGVYYNSMERLSAYAGYRLESGSAGLEVALATGYTEFGPVAPYIRGTYDITDNFRAFASTGFEETGNSLNTGAVVGVELLFK